MDGKTVIELHRDRILALPGGAVLFAELAKVSHGGLVPLYDAVTIALRCAATVNDSRQAAALARLRGDLQETES